jgi:5-methylcytosine-specific restriction endonuclease McrA
MMWLATKERERVMLHALGATTDGAAKDAFAWARRRWAMMNPREKQAVTFSRFHGACVYCGIDVVIPASREFQRSPNRGVMDHRVPVIAGGSDAFDNIALACYACNAKKGERAAL